MIPPLAAIYCPVTHLALSETTNSTASATSSTSPATLPALDPVTSFCATSSLSSPSGNHVAASVLVGPGATVLTVMPLRGPSYFPVSEQPYSSNYSHNIRGWLLLD